MLTHPAPGFVTGDRFGKRPSTNANGYQTGTMHGGQDFYPDYKGGSRTVVAAADGVLVPSPYNASGGIAVCIRHAGLPGVEATGYAHLATALLDVGTKVRAGQPIGVAGSTGASTGIHLHFDVFAALETFTRIDPLPLITGKRAPAPEPARPRRSPSMFLVQTVDTLRTYLVIPGKGVRWIDKESRVNHYRRMIVDQGGQGTITPLYQTELDAIRDDIRKAA